MVPDLNGCAASFFPFKMVLAVGLSCIFSSIIRYVSPEANSLKFKRKINNKCCQFPVSFYCSHKWFMVWLVFICLFLCVDLWLSTWLIPTTPHILPCHSFACCKIAIATGCKGSVPWPLSLCTHQKLPCSPTQLHASQGWLHFHGTKWAPPTSLPTPQARLKVSGDCAIFPSDRIDHQWCEGCFSNLS